MPGDAPDSPKLLKAGAMDLAAKIAKIRDEEREDRFGSVYFFGPGVVFPPEHPEAFFISTVVIAENMIGAAMFELVCFIRIANATLMYAKNQNGCQALDKLLIGSFSLSFS
ncbi:hypothetical protein HDU83_008023 [Entophlyctis luteolus]|nr:hypothetical protein HDU82_002179 [Entophlyctis luteolus]KAJ3338600.1 hypothetical protein HDU83_008023 [Entophlyctis luteolus]KAJ3377225.1 hypothetical protein HDU84_008880 [Entophlyctis sp. JEL0112]